jgi:hypothetical protein
LLRDTRLEKHCLPFVDREGILHDDKTRHPAGCASPLPSQERPFLRVFAFSEQKNDYEKQASAQS